MNNTNENNNNNQQINTRTETIELTLEQLQSLFDLAQMGAHHAWDIHYEQILKENETGERSESYDEFGALCNDYCFIRNRAGEAIKRLKKKRAEARKPKHIAVQ